MKRDICIVIAIVFILACLGWQTVHAEKIDKAEKKGAKITAKALSDVDKRLKKFGKLCPGLVATMTDIEAFDHLRACYGASTADKKEKAK